VPARDRVSESLPLLPSHFAAEKPAAAGTAALALTD
jgi:hypothetical protein